MYQLNHWNQGFTKDDKANDSFFVNRLQMDFAFHATDEVSVYWRLRAPAGQRWGEGSTMESIWYYGEVKQDWGTVAVGKLNDGRSDLGLASLGWMPDGPDVNMTSIYPFDFDDAIDGIHYANRWDNGFQLAAAFLRFGTEPTRSGSPAHETNDLFIIEPAFFWDGGGASLGLHYNRDHVGEDVNEPALKMFYLNPALAHSFGDFSVHFEGKAGWGSQDQAGGGSRDATGYAFYLDVDYNYGPGNINLAGWWAAGDDGTSGKDKGQVDMGGAFVPLVVAYGQPSYGWNRNTAAGGPVTAISLANERSGALGEASEANHWALDLNGAHAFTDDLTLTYALAYLALNKVDAGAKKSIGFETDLGLQIQLLDNLHFGTTLGYLFAGDALKVNDEDAKDAYTWINTLTFSF
jgi:hypothetical protein